MQAETNNRQVNEPTVEPTTAGRWRKPTFERLSLEEASSSATGSVGSDGALYQS